MDVEINKGCDLRPIVEGAAHTRVGAGDGAAHLGSAGDVNPAKRFNRLVVENARRGRLYSNLASPVARTGIPVNEFGLLALAAVFDEKTANAADADAVCSSPRRVRSGRRRVIAAIRPPPLLRAEGAV